MTKLSLSIPEKKAPEGGVATPPVVSQPACRGRCRRGRFPRKTFKCCQCTGLDAALIVGLVTSILLLGGMMHKVVRPYLMAPELSPATCTVEKILQGPPSALTGLLGKDILKPKPEDYDGGKDVPLGGEDDDDGWSRHHLPGMHHGERGDHDEGERGDHDGGRSHHRGRRGSGRRHHRKHGSSEEENRGEAVEGFDFPDEEGFMKCQDCFFSHISRCKKGRRGYRSSKLCTISRFPCVKVLVNVDADMESSEWSSEESDNHSSRRGEGKHQGKGTKDRWRHDSSEKDDEEGENARDKRQAQPPPPPPGMVEESQEEDFEDMDERESSEMNGLDLGDLRGIMRKLLPPGMALLHTDVENMENFPQCSYSVCNANETDNIKAVKEWTMEWMIRQKSEEEFDCYYDRHDPTRAYVGKVFSRVAVINAILWPALLTLVCLVALVGRRIYFGCCKRPVGVARAATYAVETPELDTKDPEKDPAKLDADLPVLKPLSVVTCPPDYGEVVETGADKLPSYSEANLQKAAKEDLTPCE